MSLAVRIIPTVLTRGRTMVKGIAFDAWRSIGLAAQAVRIHSMRGVDELVLLDITATREGRGPDLKLVEELSDTCFMPLTVGGGVLTVEDARDLLRAGADKIVIRSAGPRLAHEVARRVGSQAVVAAIDVTTLDGNPKPTSPELIELARKVAIEWEQHGAGEIMLTRCEREGTLQGYDIDLVRAVSEAVSIPVIAHGGCGNYEHMLEAVAAGASAVAAGAMFAFTDATPREAAEYLHEAGVEVRL